MIHLVKLTSPGKRAVRGLAAAGVTLASLAGLALPQTPAMADPAVTYLAVGDGTTQDVMNGWAASLGGKLLGSYNATNPLTGTAHEVITPAKTGNTAPASPAASQDCSFNRPDGSTEGILALKASLGIAAAPPIAGETVTVTGGGTTVTGPLPSGLPQANCVNIARSSSGPAASNPGSAQSLIYLPFAVDGVTASTGSAAGTITVPGTTTAVSTPATNLVPASGAHAGVAPDFTLAQLQAMYDSATPETASSNGVTYAPKIANQPTPAGDTPVDLYIPPAGSDALTFWAQQLGFSASAPPAWDHQAIAPDAGHTVSQFVGDPAGEDDGTAVTVDPNGLMPFSIAQYISQSAHGHNPRFHQARLLTVGGVSPVTAAGALNLSFPFQLLREMYNVAAYDRVFNTGTASSPDASYDPVLNQLLVSATTASPNQPAQTALLCQQALLLQSYGFAMIKPTSPSPGGLGGEAGGHYCGQVDPSNLASPVPPATFSCTTSAMVAGCPASGDYSSGVHGGNFQAAYVIQDEWNPTSALVSQVLSANSMSDWQVQANLSTGNTAVLSYPDSQDTITDPSNNPVPFGSFASITSTYAAKMPSDTGNAATGDDYEAAYDIWLGHNGGNYAQEIMVWTDTRNQIPAGVDTGTTWTDPSTGVAYEVWDSGGHDPVSLVRKSNATSGSVDLLSLFSWLRSAGLSTEAGINQIDYGFELCSTSGLTETFTVTGYTLNATCASGTSC
jgi:hypothetical protein